MRFLTFFARRHDNCSFRLGMGWVACVAAGPRTRLNHLYTEGLECLRRRLGMGRAGIFYLK